MSKALWIGLFSGAAAAVGTYLFVNRKKDGSLGDPSGVETVEKTRKGGMTVTHYRDGSMPIDKRVGIIQDMVWKSIKDPRNRKLALQFTSNCPERDGLCEAKAVYHAAKKIRYTGDVAPIKMGRNGPVEGVDLYQSAYRTWEIGGGDCDDSAIFNSTHLALNGIPAQLRVTAPRKNSDWQHIYVVAGLPKGNPTKWVALDSTLPGSDRFGYEVPYGKKKDFPV